MAEVIICCGKICSGKTTFCSKLEQEKGVVVFNADEWMIHFFGEAPDCDVFHYQLEKCIQMIYSTAEKFLYKGISVAFDFGFWTRKDREACYTRFSNGKNEVTVVYFPIDDKIQLSNMNKRQKGKMTNTFSFTKEKLAFFNAKFEEPGENECIRVENFIF